MSKHTLSILQPHGAFHVKVNEAVAFSDEVFKNLKRKILHISKLTGRIETQNCWSNEKYNRSGIPLYIYWNKT